MGLFDADAEGDEPPTGRSSAPLADRMRPRDLDELVGQEHLVGPRTALRRAIERDEVSSLLLWGPPGSGKTTLARIIARYSSATFVPFSAVLAGIKEVRQVMEQAALRIASGRGRTILFIDEIHRFNRAQQDAFLPHVEAGTVVLIGATTENPSFEVNSALLSRARVCRLERLTEEQIARILRTALDDAERGLGSLQVDVEDSLLLELARQSQGDARAALGVLELAAREARGRAGAGRSSVDRDLLRDVLQRGALYYDRAGEEHFNLISALHKSMRNSDPDASLYWLLRMLDSGEDPLYVARRVVRFASEDVGLADPRALTAALDAKEAVHFLGLPEGELALAQAVVYCALAPKSNAIYRACAEAREAIAEGFTDPVPLSLRNAPTDLMKREGYGAGYRYAHDHPDAVTDLTCLPERLKDRRFYSPTTRGHEGRLARRLARRKPPGPPRG